MRIYVPLTPQEIEHDEISPRLVHAVTPDLSRVFPREGEEELEYVAFLAAADDSLRALTTVPRRVVAVADVPTPMVELPAVDEEILESGVHMAEPLSWDRVESIHIDEAEAEAVIRDAIAGDERAFEESAEIDLLWYDILERAALIAALTN